MSKQKDVKFQRIWYLIIIIVASLNIIGFFLTVHNYRESERLLKSRKDLLSCKYTVPIEIKDAKNVEIIAELTAPDLSVFNQKEWDIDVRVRDKKSTKYWRYSDDKLDNIHREGNWTIRLYKATSTISGDDKIHSEYQQGCSDRKLKNEK